MRRAFAFRGRAKKTIFGKGEKDNLSKAERNELAELVGLLKDLAGGEK